YRGLYGRLRFLWTRRCTKARDPQEVWSRLEAMGFRQERVDIAKVNYAYAMEAVGAPSDFVQNVPVESLALSMLEQAVADADIETRQERGTTGGSDRWEEGSRTSRG